MGQQRDLTSANQYLVLSANTSRAALLLFCLAAMHRLLQWWLLSPALQVLAQANPQFQVMQLLPRDLWRTHFGEALLYLQQSPPLPNLLFGLTALLTTDPWHETTAFILFQGLLHAVSTALLFLLLAHLNVNRLLSFVIALLFIVNIDFIVIEYSALGQLFYEPLAMLLCLCAAYCAARIANGITRRNLLLLGVIVAALALTRASFSYFAAPVFLWVLFVCVRQQRAALCIAFLLPAFLLQGSWAMKQAWTQGELQWATSSWGGLNIQSGDIKRVFARIARNEDVTRLHGISLDALAGRIDCLQRWRHIESTGFYAEQQLMAPHPVDAGPSARAIAVDNASTAARGVRISADSAVAREYSQCLQRAYLAFWQDNPGYLLQSWWRSYGMFWAPIRDFAEIYPLTLLPTQKRWDNPESQPLWQPAGDFSPPQYLLRQDRYPDFFPTPNILATTQITLLGMPLLPQAMSLLAMLALHLAPLLYALVWLRNRRSVSQTDIALLFMYLAYGYLAVISNIGEYGENMRFRVVVEPLVWCIAAATLSHIWTWIRTVRRPRPPVP